MKTRLILATCLILTFLTACQSLIPTPTATPTNTPTPTATLTPTLTSTITPTPTPIGSTEPKIAFVGKDPQGNLGIYMDGLYTRKPEKISPVIVPEDRAPFLNMRWSPDGKRLVFENNDELKRRSFFLFDIASNSVQEITRIPSGKYVFDFNWSLDGNTLYFGMASIGSHTIFLEDTYFKLDLSNGQISKAIKFYPPNNSNSHVNSGANCNSESFPSVIHELTFGGMGGYGRNGVIYDYICFYPELNIYGGLKYNEQTTDFVFITEEGEVGKILVTFPANFYGGMDLRLSPDKSQILIIGEGGDDKKGGQFVYAAQLTSLPIDKSDPQILDTWHYIHVFGWSPDSMNYLVAEVNNKIGEQEGHFEIIRASSGDVVYEYKIQNQVTPVFIVWRGAGFDMVWPVSP